MKLARASVSNNIASHQSRDVQFLRIDCIRIECEMKIGEIFPLISIESVCATVCRSTASVSGHTQTHILMTQLK